MELLTLVLILLTINSVLLAGIIWKLVNPSNDVSHDIFRLGGELKDVLYQRFIDIESKMTQLTERNDHALEKIRETVDEKLQTTLERKIKESFGMVSERLEQVHKGLGEMQTLATGVGDLKKVLSNVKTRGIVGEIQLMSLVEQVLTPEMYYTNVALHPDHPQVIELAIKIPAVDSDDTLLPIDSKFPLDPYSRLVDAYEGEDKALIASCRKELQKAVMQQAKKIIDLYRHPPYTTDVVVLFVPFEGLYAEISRIDGLMTRLHQMQVVLAGPSTLYALLTSLQLGFRTIAIHRRSGEVRETLVHVKQEIEKFGSILLKAQKKLRDADRDIDHLLTTRTQQLTKRLSHIEDGTEKEEEV